MRRPDILPRESQRAWPERDRYVRSGHARGDGLPVAALPVTGPIDVLRNGETGVLDEDLVVARRKARALDRGAASPLLRR